MLSFFNVLKRTTFEFFNFFFLSRCAACDESGSRPFCTLCQEALLHAPQNYQHNSFLGSLWLYGGPFAQAFTKAKFAGHAMEMDSLLDWSMISGFSEERRHLLLFSQFDVVTWVPSHPLRRVARGFQASHVFALNLASQLQIPAKSLIKCVRNDAPFSLGTNRQERQRKIRGRFKIKNTILPNRVLLVDDIKTTGATLSEAQKVLEDQGIEVYTFVLAQTPAH